MQPPLYKNSFHLLANIAIQGFYSLSQLLIIIALSKSLTPNEFGLTGLIITLFVIFQSFSLNGLENYLFSQCGTNNMNFIGSNYWLTTKKYIINYSIFSLFFITAYIYVQNISFPHKLQILICLWGGLLISALNSFHGATLRCQGLNLTVNFINNVLRPTLFIASLPLLYFLSPKLLNAPDILSLYFLCFIFPLILFIKKYNYIKRNHQSNIANTLYQEKNNGVITIIMTGLPSFLLILNSQLDILIIGLLSHPEKVAVYKVASTISLVLVIPLTAVIFYLAPNLKKILRLPQPEAENIIRYPTRIALSLSAIGLVFLIIFGEKFIAYVFGLNYLDAYPIMLILSLGSFTSVAMGANMVSLLVINQSKSAIKLILIVVLLNLFFNPLTIYFFDILGAAIITMLSVITLNILLTKSVFKYTGVCVSSFKWL